MLLFVNSTIFYVLRGETKTKRKKIDISNEFFFRHLKFNEKKFNETLNDTQFGLKAQVRCRTKKKFFEIFSWSFLQGPAAIVALKLLEDKTEYRCAFLQSPVTNLSIYRKTNSTFIKMKFEHFCFRCGFYWKNRWFVTSEHQIGKEKTKKLRQKSIVKLHVCLANRMAFSKQNFGIHTRHIRW